MKLVFAEEARRDLFAIGDYIAKDNPRRALSFVEEIEWHRKRIADHPLAYALVPRHEASGIRRAVYGRIRRVRTPFTSCT
jgi:plasmid stabilization system protein ParE